MNMTTAPDYRPAAYIIVLLGLGIAVGASFVPFYTAGYELETTALLAVLTPFLIYGALTETLHGLPLLLSGLVLLAVAVAVVVPERYLHYDGYADGTIFWVPLLAAAIALPIAYLTGGRHKGTSHG
jgi:hypothetical protein